MEQFWGSTLQEIVDIIESKRRMVKAEEKMRIGHLFVLAEAISTRIGYFFSDPEKRTESMILQAWDAYPELFDDTKKEAEMRKEQAEQEIQRQKVIDWANHINAQRHRKEDAE